MYDDRITIHDRLEEILESIKLVQEWSRGRATVNDFLLSSTGVSALKALDFRYKVKNFGQIAQKNAEFLDAF